MEKILIIQYTPRNERSSTKKILDSFIEKNKGEIKVIDLSKEKIEFFNNESLSAYTQRNYMKKTLSADEEKILVIFDKYIAQIKNADTIVFAYPMYNFSMPGVVKSFFDMVLFKGETWDMDDNGNYIGLLRGKKAVLITSSGGIYDEKYNTLAMDHNVSLFKLLMGFIGIEDVRMINAQGINAMPNEKERIISDAISQI